MTKPVKLDYHITAFSAVDNDELREIVKQGKQSIVAETLDKTLACTYKVYGDKYVHVEFADNVISYIYDQYGGWSVRGVSREDSVSALKALYVKLGGDYTNVAGCVTDLEVLNKISVLYNGKDGARNYGEAVMNITEKYAGGAEEPYVEYTFNENQEVVAAKFFGFEEIPQHMLYAQPELLSIDLSGSPNLKTVNNSAFESNSKLELVSGMPEGTVSIGESAFKGCTSLTIINLPNSLTSIGHMAFYGCQALELIKLPDSLTSIGNQAFYGCRGISITSLSSSITSVGSSAFYQCYGLTNIEIACGSIGANCFNSCTGIQKVWIRSTCTSIFAPSTTTGPFNNCSSSMVIYAEPSYKPSGWGTYFNRRGSSYSYTVTYNQTTSPF